MAMPAINQSFLFENKLSQAEKTVADAEQIIARIRKCFISRRSDSAMEMVAIADRIAGNTVNIIAQRLFPLFLSVKKSNCLETFSSKRAKVFGC